MGCIIRIQVEIPLELEQDFYKNLPKYALVSASDIVRRYRVPYATARAIYDDYKAGLLVVDIAAKYEVGRTTVSRIAHSPHEYGLKLKPMARQGKPEKKV